MRRSMPRMRKNAAPSSDETLIFSLSPSSDQSSPVNRRNDALPGLSSHSLSLKTPSAIAILPRTRSPSSG